MLLDAECASAGDPAFDLAFCANHLLLKAVWRPAWAERFVAAFDALVAGYSSAVSWEAAVSGGATDVLRLLPALALARVDGLSPVEYLSEDDRVRVRAVGRRPVDHAGGQSGRAGERWVRR